VTGDDAWVIDDLTYVTGSTSAVPEPGSLALISHALAGMGALSCRRWYDRGHRRGGAVA
jgi:hypothetical protein